MSAPAIHDTGEGEALLLLHAFPLDGSQWDSQVAALSDRYRCLRPDFWGCGDSPAPPAEVTLDSWARTVLESLDQRGIATATVIGSSMGGYSAFALWRLAPQRVRSLVLVGTRAAADTDAARKDRATLAASVRSGGVEVLVEPNVTRLLCPRCREEVHIADPLRGRIRRWTPAGVDAALGAMAQRDDSGALLAGITVPTLVVAGTRDAVVPLEESRAMAAAIPAAMLEELDEAGHLPNVEQPQRTARLIGDFLDRGTAR